MTDFSAKSPTRATETTVLVVEAHAAQRESLGRVLRGEGHTVLEASSAEAGLTLLRAGEGGGKTVSVVVVGDGPLGRTGSRLLRGMARGCSCRTPAVLLTTCESLGDGHELTLGLRKPFQVEELLAVVSDFQRRQRPD